MVQAELQDSVKELTKSRKKYQEAETMAQAVREKAELDAKYDPNYSPVLLWLKSYYPNFYSLKQKCVPSKSVRPLLLPLNKSINTLYVNGTTVGRR